MTDQVLIPRAMLQQVLDALTNDGCHEEGCPDSNDCFNDQCDYCAPIRDTRTAMAMKQVKAALAAPCDPQQEPVGFVGAGYITLGEGRISETQTDVYRVPVYTAPPAAQPQPLTDEHIAELLIKHLESNDGYYQFARAIEAHHNIRSKE